MSFHVGGRLSSVALGAAVLVLWGMPAGADVQSGSADAVVGQSDLSSAVCNRRTSPRTTPSAPTVCTPMDVAVDPISGRLYVADPDVSRVASWPTAAAFANGQAADLVLGQPDLTSRGCNQNDGGATPAPASAATLCGPGPLAFDAAGRLYVADAGNNRVLRFAAPQASRQAELVLGEPDFTTRDSASCSVLGAVNATNFCFPSGLAVDLSSGRVYVAEGAKNRVLAFDNPLTNGQPADLVLGQPDFTSSGDEGCTPEGPSSLTLCSPSGLAVDPAFGRLYVADSGMSRVMSFDHPTSNGQAANMVLGQPTFAHGPEVTTCNQGAGLSGPAAATTLCSPIGLAVDPFGRLYVADTSNNRVLEYDRPTDSGPAADRVLGQPDFAKVGCNTGGVGARSLCGPAAVATDRLANLYVADIDNARVLRFGGLPPIVRPTPVPTPAVPVQLPTSERGK